MISPADILLYQLLIGVMKVPWMLCIFTFCECMFLLMYFVSPQETLCNTEYSSLNKHHCKSNSLSCLILVYIANIIWIWTMKNTRFWGHMTFELKGIVYPIMKIVIIYLFQTGMSFSLLLNSKDDILNKVGNKTEATDFCSIFFMLWKSVATVNCATMILLWIYCV